MSKKRSRLQVIYDILGTLNKKDGVKPTHILYKSNLSHQMMQEYLTELIDKKLVEKTELEKGKTYSLTKKGQDYLSEYKRMVGFMESFGLN